MDDFPICVRKIGCNPLQNDTIRNAVVVKYESTINGENGEFFIPNGKMALFSCNSSETEKNNETVYELHGISRIICLNGEWHGLSPNEKPNCVLKNSISMASVTISVSKRVIRILSGVLVVCLISIVCLIVYMFRDRKIRHKKRMEELKSRILSNDYNVSNVYYDSYDECNIYDHTTNDYDYICNDLLQDNPLYRDDLSVETECHKTNSIYSI